MGKAEKRMLRKEPIALPPHTHPELMRIIQTWMERPLAETGSRQEGVCFGWLPLAAYLQDADYCSGPRKIPADAQQPEEQGQHIHHLPLPPGPLPPASSKEKRAANLSPGPWRAAPAGHVRSSEGCPHAVRSRSRPSHLPTHATSQMPPPGWTRAPAPHGPLQGDRGAVNKGFSSCVPLTCTPLQLCMLQGISTIPDPSPWLLGRTAPKRPSSPP